MRKFDRNDRVLAICFAVAAGMLGLSYASVPLYRIFCQATGFDGTPKIYAAASTSTSDRTIQIRFDSNVGQGLPWDFRPEIVSTKTHLGEHVQAYFLARNTSNEAVTGKARFNVTPLKAGTYVSKLQCFCFDNQELKSGQFVRMGVSFYVDPRIATDPETKDVTAITLSYTFFPAKFESETKTVAAVAPR
jgi:cytochrome c oxidase assembly protein subunit 11